jgi:phthiodiolone/phenolphthiodiolone dimycocerosates ketoreductase
MKFGMVLPTFYRAALNKLVLDAAEAMPADSLWVVDHLMGVFSRSIYSEMPISEIAADPDAILDPFCLSTWAGRTTTTPLEAAVTDAIRRSAADTARTALSLQHLCSGGLTWELAQVKLKISRYMGTPLIIQ